MSFKKKNIKICLNPSEWYNELKSLRRKRSKSFYKAVPAIKFLKANKINDINKKVSPILEKNKYKISDLEFIKKLIFKNFHPSFVKIYTNHIIYMPPIKDLLCYIMTNYYPIVLIEPDVIRKNNRGEFHCETGHAIEWSDNGEGFYFYNGHIMSRKFFEKENYNKIEQLIYEDEDSYLRTILLQKIGRENAQEQLKKLDNELYERFLCSLVLKRFEGKRISDNEWLEKLDDTIREKNKMSEKQYD